MLRKRPNSAPFSVGWKEILIPAAARAGVVDELSMAADVMENLNEEYLLRFRTSLLRLVSVDQMLEWLDQEKIVETKDMYP